MDPHDHAESVDPVRLSKLLAFALRHRPDALGLTLDAEGWADLDDVVAQVNAHRRLPGKIGRSDLERLALGEGHGRFELRSGRIRARGGHTVVGVDATDDLEAPAPTPGFLFVGVEAADLEQAEGQGYLEGHDGTLLTLHADEAAALGVDPGREVVIVDAERAIRQGTVFAAGETGTHLAARVPLRFLLSQRHGFERQVSAGGVLARGRGDDAEFALIRTLPRAQALGEQPAAAPDDLAEPEAGPEDDDDELPSGEFEDARAGADRRGPDRRQREGAPPDGIERRTGPRRTRRRRRSGRWGAEGRLELPKGKLEPGETPEQAAVREVREELGIAEDLVVDAALSTNHYVFRTPEGRMIFKTVHYFLLRCPDGAPQFSPRREEGIVSVEWWPGPRAIAQVAFKNLRPVLERAWELLQAPGR